MTATHVSTGVDTVRQATGAGVYTVSPLAPGEYRVTVVLQGFQTFVQESVTVDALGVVGLNVTLKVGGITQEVTVSATPPMLRTADGRLGQTIRNEVYTALPLVMNTGGPRDPTAFMFLMPGVQSVGRWGNVMGGQDFTNETYVEGVPITNAVVQGEGRNLSMGISVEAIDQFQVETSGTAVMYSGQGASNYVVKSGTNLFRGSAFEFFRNKGLDSKAFFAAAKPDDNQHEFGFTLGGPLRRNQAFFFVAYDGYRDRRQTESRLISIPTAAQRNGDFSALPVVIYDPATTRPNPNGTGFVRDPFPGNIIPASRISPISRNLQSYLPAPSNGNLQNNYLGGLLPIGFNNDNVTAKVDLRLSSRHQVAVLFAHGKRSQATPYRGGGNAQTQLPLPYTETRLVEEIPTTAQVKHTYVMGGRWVNQASLGFARLSVPIFNATVDGRYPIEAGITGLPAGEADSAFPEISFAGPNAPTNWRGTDSRAFTEYLNNYTFQDNLQWTAGRHGVTFGFQAQRMDANERERTYGSLATFAFSNSQTAGFTGTGTLNAATGHPYASFLLGELSGTNVIEDSEVATSGRFRTYAFWVQDDFKVNARLALNLGLRYDIMQPYTEVYDRWSFMNPDLPNPAVGGYPGAIQFAGFGDNSCQCRTPIETYYGNIGPRLGAAYSLNDRTVLRGSYGVMYSRRGAVGGRAGARNGTGTLGFSANASFTSSNGFAPAYNWNNGVPSYPDPPFLDPTLNAGFVTGRGNGGGVTYGDPEIGGRPPRYQNWNVGTQYALTSMITVGAAYAGSHGDFLGGSGRGFYANQLDPRYLVLGNLLTQTANAANIAAARAIVPDVALPYANFSGTIGQMLRPFPQYSGVTDVYGNVATLELPLAPADHGAAALARPDPQRQLHVQPHRGQPRRAHRLRLRAGLGSRRQRSAAHLQPDGGLRPAVREGGPAGQRQWLRGGAGPRLAGVGDHAVPLGPAARRDPRPLQPAERRYVLRRLQPGLLGPRPHQRRLRRRRRARDDAAHLHRPQRLRVGAGVHLRQHAAHARPRPAQPEQRQPGSEHPARLRAARAAEAPPRGGDLQPVQHGGLRRHQHQHHQRQLRPGQLADQPAARGADQGAGRLLMRGDF